jgi:hypothetical protein
MKLKAHCKECIKNDTFNHDICVGCVHNDREVVVFQKPCKDCPDKGSGVCQECYCEQCQRGTCRGCNKNQEYKK